MRFTRIFPWRAELQDAKRDATAAAREGDMVRMRRPLVERIVYELGQHKRENHFVDIIAAVTRGARP